MMEEFVHMQILEHRRKQPNEVGFVTPKHTLPVLPDPASWWPISLGVLMPGPWSHLCQYTRCAWNPLDRHVNKHSQMKLVCTWARRKLLSMPNQLNTYLSLKKNVCSIQLSCFSILMKWEGTDVWNGRWSKFPDESLLAISTQLCNDTLLASPVIPYEVCTSWFSGQWGHSRRQKNVICILNWNS